MERDALIGNVVQRANGRRPGIVIVEFPGGEHAVAAHAAGQLDDAGRTEVRPSEFLLARPHKLDRLAGGLGQARASIAASPECLPP